MLTVPVDARPTTTARWVAPVLAPVALAAVAALALAPDPGATGGVILAAAAWGGILVLVLLAATAVPLLTARPPGRSTDNAWWALAVVGLFVMLTSLAARIPRMGPFVDLDRHWQGKVLDLVWVGILFLVLSRWAREDAGMRWRLGPGSSRRALLVVGGVFVVLLALTVLAVLLDRSAHQDVGLEQVLFNATIPNLTEELIWRGAMLAVLDRVFGTPWRLWGAPVGWGLVITSVVFGAGHMILLSPDGVLSLNVAGGLFATAMGVLLAWIRACTGSIWPAFLLHCAPEVAVDVGMLATAGL